MIAGTGSRWDRNSRDVEPIPETSVITTPHAGPYLFILALVLH